MIPQDPKMSIAPTDAAARKPPQEFDLAPPEPRRAKILEWSITGPTVAILVLGCVVWWPTVADSALWMIPWLLLVTATELLPVYYTDQVNLTLSMPLLLAAGMT